MGLFKSKIICWSQSSKNKEQQQVRYFRHVLAAFYHTVYTTREEMVPAFKLILFARAVSLLPFTINIFTGDLGGWGHD